MNDPTNDGHRLLEQRINEEAHQVTQEALTVRLHTAQDVEPHFDAMHNNEEEAVDDEAQLNQEQDRSAPKSDSKTNTNKRRKTT